MAHKGTLSSAFNMSLGFIPVIISILLCEFITQDTAIYIGTGIGIIGIYLSYRRKGLLIPNFILYIATGVLALLSIAALIPGDYVPPGALPLTLEVSILIPMLSLYMHKKRFINHFLKQIGSCNKRLYAQGAEAAVVSARIALIFGILHFIIISITVIFQNPLSKTSLFVLYKVLPPTLQSISTCRICDGYPVQSDRHPFLQSFNVTHGICSYCEYQRRRDRENTCNRSC